MRWISSLGLVAMSVMILAPVAVSPATAADLSVTPGKTVHKVVRIHHRRALRVVRDYDGVPILLRRRHDGTEDAYFAERASPTRYLNGRRVAVYL